MLIDIYYQRRKSVFSTNVKKLSVSMQLFVIWTFRYNVEKCVLTRSIIRLAFTIITVIGYNCYRPLHPIPWKFVLGQDQWSDLVGHYYWGTWVMASAWYRNNRPALPSGNVTLCIRPSRWYAHLAQYNQQDGTCDILEIQPVYLFNDN